MLLQRWDQVGVSQRVGIEVGTQAQDHQGRRGRVSMRVIVTARMVAATTLGSCAQGGDECPPLGLVATGCEDFLELEGYSRV
jgi:hypothetical protein